MQELRITATLAPELVPPLYATVGESGAVTELRVVDWNLAADDAGTLLYAIDGDADAFRDAARATDGVERVALSRSDRAAPYALVNARPAAVPFFSTFVSVTARAGLVVRKPLVYRDGRSTGRVVGEPGPLQAAVDETPPGVDVRVERIGRFPSHAEDRSRRLSDRQREAVEAALELGYYDQPREATHAEIAAELECAPNTATTHLQKGEAKLVRAAMEARDRRRP